MMRREVEKDQRALRLWPMLGTGIHSNVRFCCPSLALHHSANERRNKVKKKIIKLGLNFMAFLAALVGWHRKYAPPEGLPITRPGTSDNAAT